MSYVATMAHPASPTSPSLKTADHFPSAVKENGENHHGYRPPNGASRSPCPCLNALANHSYLPHDGKAISFSDIISALQEGMGLSPSFALFMAIGTFTLLRRPSLAPFDLHGATRHDFIEHNASMVHDDCPPGAKYASTEVNPDLLRRFLDTAHPSSSDGKDVITQDDITALRIEREAVCNPVDALHAELGRAEFALTMEIFGRGKDRELSPAEMEAFLGKERFPDGWRPTHTVHLWEAASRSTQIRNAMKKIRETVPEEKKGTADQGVIDWIKSIVERSAGHS